MKEGKASEAKSGNKGLVILLCVLAVVIVGLGVGISVVMLSNRESGGVVVENEDQVLEEETAYYEYADDFAAVLAEADELLRQNPVNVEAIKLLFREPIDRYLENGDYTDIVRAATYVTAETQKMLSGGFEREALDELLRIDLSVFNKPEQYRQYMTVIDIAGNLGEDAIVSEYKILADGVRDDFMASCAGSTEKAREYGIDVDDGSPLCGNMENK